MAGSGLYIYGAYVGLRVQASGIFGWDALASVTSGWQPGHLARPGVSFHQTGILSGAKMERRSRESCEAGGGRWVVTSVLRRLIGQVIAFIALLPAS